METSENIQYIESCTIQMENYTKITKKIHVQYKLKKNTQCRYNTHGWANIATFDVIKKSYLSTNTLNKWKI